MADRKVYVRFTLKKRETGASLAVFDVTLDVPAEIEPAEVERHIAHLRLQAMRELITIDETAHTDIPGDEVVRRDTFGQPNKLWSDAITEGK
jgi:hypothetical protein